MGLKAAVQALKKAEEIKARVSRHDDLLNNSEVWSDQQQLQTVYHQVLVLDLEYALDKKVEQELWTLGFKNHIGALQHLSKDRKNPKRSEYQALLSWCLEAASGFYLTLLQELCTTFELDLPFRRRASIYGQTSKTQMNNNNGVYGGEQPQKSSCLYICQYCLVHLGDIARYRSQRKQAESFYRHAILLSPSSGQPYNQLALLEASRGDKLATVFHYVRSISVKHPFPAAATNLANTLSAAIDHQECIVEVHSKLSLMEFLSMFLRVHGLLHLAVDLDQAELYVKSLNATFTALVATNAFSSMKLIQMTTINLYALRHTLDSFSTEQLTPDELRVKQLILDLLAGAFSAYLLPIYTMVHDASLLEYCALPAIKLTLDWIKSEPNVLRECVFAKRLQIWPSLCKLLNVLQTFSSQIEAKNFDKIPLPEDRDLQCFLPLVNAYKDVDFTSCVNPNHDANFFNNLRVKRLIQQSVWLSTQTIDNNVFITAKKMKNPNNIVFEPCIQQPDPTTELLNELKHFSIKDNADKSPSRTEKRGGILKPQGSLEKAREERISSTNISIPNCVPEANETTTTVLTTITTPTTIVTPTIATTKLKRNRQNVAMQALAKKVEETSKQVKFVTEPQQQPQCNAINAMNAMNAMKPVFPMAMAPRQYPHYGNQNQTDWMHDDKLPMPPSTWTWPQNVQTNTMFHPSHNQNYTFNTPQPQPQPQPQQQIPKANNFLADNTLTTYDSTSFNNPAMSLWSSSPNFQPNLQMIFNQSKQNSNLNPNPNPNPNPTAIMGEQSTSGPAVSSGAGGGGYSLFNSNWAPNLTVHSSLKYNQNAVDRGPPLMRQQSLFSGPGPSPLERLLQQQKQQRGGPNTSNDHT